MVPGTEKGLALAEALIERLRAATQDAQSREAYVIRNLESFTHDIRDAHSVEDVLLATKPLSHFAVDSLDWGSDLMNEIAAITRSVRRGAKGYKP